MAPCAAGAARSPGASSAHRGERPEARVPEHHVVAAPPVDVQAGQQAAGGHARHRAHARLHGTPAARLGSRRHHAPGGTRCSADKVRRAAGCSADKVCRAAALTVTRPTACAIHRGTHACRGAKPLQRRPGSCKIACLQHQGRHTGSPDCPEHSAAGTAPRAARR